jgi:hypothetical protein
MASLQLSNLPLPVSPLRMCWDKSDNVNTRAGGRKVEGYSHQNDALILGGPLHVVYASLASCNVPRKGLLVIGNAMMLGGVLVKNRVGVG